VDGIDVMRDRRHAARRDRDLASGPARLTQALGITGACNGADLVRGPVRLLDDGAPPPRRPGRSTRVGLKPGEGDGSRWRWFVRDDPNVSPGRPSAGR
jgi:DNA-3-methyladenine glycosylase